MSKALTDISSYEALNRAWKNLFNNARVKSRDTSGVDGVSLNTFRINEVVNLLSISRRLRHGRYYFSNLKPNFLIKPNGKERVICVPTTEDRIVQAALLEYLSAKYTARFSNKVSYGFIKGRGVQAAALLAKVKREAQPWVFKTDVCAFFDNIDRDDLKQKIKRTVRQSSLHSLLFQIVDCEVQADTKNVATRIARQGIQQGKGVRQGMALSPFFSNIVLERFDNAVEATGYSALRYADDLIFFGTTRAQCEQMEQFAIKALAREGLKIPPSNVPDSKSVYFGPSEPAEFLGIAISRSTPGKYALKLLPVQLDEIRKAFLDLANVKQLNARNINLGHLGQHLKSKKSGYIQAYSHIENLAELDNCLDDIERKVLRTIYIEDLKIDLGKISPDAYAFLGLN